MHNCPTGHDGGDGLHFEPLPIGAMVQLLSSRDRLAMADDNPPLFRGAVGVLIDSVVVPGDGAVAQVRWTAPVAVTDV